MKKLFVILIAIMAVAFVSCQKVDEGLEQQYASAISVPENAFVIEDGDIQLKSAPMYSGHEFRCLRKFPANYSPWAYVDGTEFLPGSAAQLDWGTTPLKTKWWFENNTTVRVTYCPAVPMRFVSIAKESENGKATYLGLYDCTPNSSSFPITLKGRRLGDVLKINVDALTALPGYTNMHFEVIYNKNVIDLEQTIFGSYFDTKDGWPEYVYDSLASGSVTHQIGAIANQGMQTVYDDTDATITGTITVKIYVDNAVIVKTVEAPGSDQGLAITLTTTKVGWYNSANIALTDTDINVQSVNIEVD